MYCENCGARIDNDSVFCENCGVMVKSQGETQPEWGGAVKETIKMQPLTNLDQLMDEEGFKELLSEEAESESDLEEEPEPESKPEFSGERKSASEESALESESEPVAESEPEYKPESEPKYETESEPEPEAEPEAESEPDSEPDEGSALESEEEPNQKMELETESEPESKPEFSWEPEPESVSASEDPALQADSESSVESEAEVILESISEPKFKIGSEEGDETESRNAVFCMVCGKKLPAGAAFCDACGTATGETVPDVSYIKNMKQAMLGELAKDFFTKPADTIKRAATEDAFLPGVGFYLIKDIIVTILAAVFMSKLSASLSIFGAMITGGDVFGFGARIFLIAILMDALWVGVLYGIGRLFRGSGSFKDFAGACGTSSIFASALLIITIVLMGVFPAATACGILVTVAGLIISADRAVAAAMEVSDNLRIYMVPTAVLIYGVIMNLIMNISI